MFVWLRETRTATPKPSQDQLKPKSCTTRNVKAAAGEGNLTRDLWKNVRVNS